MEMWKKKMVAICLLVVMLSLYTCPAFAQKEMQDDTKNAMQDVVILMPESDICYVNGERRSVGDVAPTIVNDRTLVPARFLTESFGGVASWEGKTATATLQVDDRKIDVPIGENHIVINGKKQELDVGGSLIHDRTMLPLRGICEAMGKSVHYDAGLIFIGPEKFDPEKSMEPWSEYILRHNLSDARTEDVPAKSGGIEELAGKSFCVNVEPTDVPYKANSGACYLSMAKLNMVNLEIYEKDLENYVMSFDAYNQRESYGAVQVYDAEGNLKKSVAIKPYGGAMTTSLKGWFDQAANDLPASFKALKEYASGNLEYIDYKSQSNVTRVSVEVPRNGYALITTNSTESQMVSRRNIAHLIAELFCTLYSVTGAFDVASTKDVDVLIKEALESELEKLLISNTELYMELFNIYASTLVHVTLDPFDAENSAENMLKELFRAIAESDLDILSMIEDATQSALTSLANESGVKIGLNIKEELPLVGAAFAYMDAMADTFNFITFAMDYAYSRKTASAVFTFKDDYSKYRVKMTTPTSMSSKRSYTVSLDTYYVDKYRWSHQTSRKGMEASAFVNQAFSNYDRAYDVHQYSVGSDTYWNIVSMDIATGKEVWNIDANVGVTYDSKVVFDPNGDLHILTSNYTKISKDGAVLATVPLRMASHEICWVEEQTLFIDYYSSTDVGGQNFRTAIDMLTGRVLYTNPR